MVRSPVAPTAQRTGASPRTRGLGRPRLWAELLLIGVCYMLYSMIRNLVPEQRATAMQRAQELMELQRALRIDIERTINDIFVDMRWLGMGANYYYATLHFVVPILVLCWLYKWHPHRYSAYRWLLFGTTIVSMIGFWLYPLAPPRFLPGYVDTVVEFDTWGLFSDTSPVAAVSNQYAAMPSVHTAWSLWCAIAVCSVATSRWLKALAALYPLVTVLVIMGTANHFILDAVGGALALLLAYWIIQLSPKALRRFNPATAQS